jgi:hypothetical protein
VFTVSEHLTLPESFKESVEKKAQLKYVSRTFSMFPGYIVYHLKAEERGKWDVLQIIYPDGNDQRVFLYFVEHEDYIFEEVTTIPPAPTKMQRVQNFILETPLPTPKVDYKVGYVCDQSILRDICTHYLQIYHMKVPRSFAGI